MQISYKYRLLLLFFLFYNKLFGANLAVNYAVTNSWSGGCQVQINVTNNTSSAITNWSVAFGLNSGQQITNLWNGNYTVSGSNVVVTNPSWFTSLAPNASTNFGFTMNTTTTNNVNNLIAYSGNTPPTSPTGVAPSPTGTTAPTGSTGTSAPTGTTSPTGTPAPTGPTGPTILPLTATSSVKCSWPVGYEIVISITNNTNQAINNWTAIFNLEPNQTIVDSWGANLNTANSNITATSLSGTTLAVNAIATFGLIIHGTGLQQVDNLTASTNLSPTSPTGTTGGSSTTNYKMIGYYPDWLIYAKPYIQSFQVSDIQANLLTHVNYAFAKPYTSDSNHNVISYAASLFDVYSDTQYNGGNLTQLQQLKQQYPHLKTMISIGGWTILNEGPPAAKFSTLAATESLRQQFINSVINLCITYDFDGVDIDWEYPAYAPNGGQPQDVQNYTTLIQELYAALKNTQALATMYQAQGKTPKSSLLLSICAPAGYQNFANMQISQLSNYVDWMNVMCYDFHGDWDPITGHNAPLNQTQQGDPLFNVKSAMNQYVQAGVPTNKLILGMPLYGHSFSGVQSTTDGLYASYAGDGDGTDPNQPGTLSYYDIVNRYLPTYTRYWDSQCQVPYLFNNSSKQFISYDDPQSLAAKVQYLQNMNFGGVSLWTLAKETPQWTLINNIYNNLGMNITN